MRLNTPRLLLRDFEADDWQAVQEYAADPEAVRFRPFGPCTDKETQAVILASAQQRYQPQRTLYDLAIVRTEDARLIGGCDIGLLASQPDEGSIGYGLSRDYWGQGYMTEAAQALLTFGFTTLNARRLSAEVEPDNIASVRVLEKIGMHYVDHGQQWIKGEQRDMLFYALSAHEWWAGHRDETHIEASAPE